MSVGRTTAKHTAEYEAQTYYFCSPGCKTKFDSALAGASTESELPAAKGSILSDAGDIV